MDLVSASLKEQSEFYNTRRRDPEFWKLSHLLTKSQKFRTDLECCFWSEGHEDDIFWHCMLFCFFTICSSIHDHTDSHCFMKLLQGQLKETLFEWPDSKSQGEMVQKSQRILQENKVAYINGEKPDNCFFSFLFFFFIRVGHSVLKCLDTINTCLCVWG